MSHVDFHVISGFPRDRIDDTTFSDAAL